MYLNKYTWGTTTASSGPGPLNHQNVSDDSHPLKCVLVFVQVFVHEREEGQAISNSQKMFDT